jgi:DNA-binding NarL/FixJ family response regulator
MKENWYALFIAIEKSVSIEQALKYMRIKTNYVKKNEDELIKETEKLIALKKKGYSYKKIADICNMSPSTIRWRITKLKRIKEARV